MDVFFANMDTVMTTGNIRSLRILILAVRLFNTLIDAYIGA